MHRNTTHQLQKYGDPKRGKKEQERMDEALVMVANFFINGDEERARGRERGNERANGANC